MSPPDPWDDDTAYDEREDEMIREQELDDDDGEGPFTRSNPFGERD